MEFKPVMAAAEAIRVDRAVIAAHEAEPQDWVRAENAGQYERAKTRLAAVEADPAAWDAAYKARQAKMEEWQAQQHEGDLLHRLFGFEEVPPTPGS